MAERRNLVFICTDQQRTDTMAAYGNDWIETPNLNDLSSRSFIFENAYITQPVCSPARASIMTGLYPHSAGVIKNSNPHRANSNLTPDVQTIAQMISDDYLCAYFGKWHLGDDLSAQHGFERWLSVEDGHDNDYPNYHNKEHRFRKSDYFKFLESKGHTPEGDYEGHKSFTQPQRGYLPEEDAMATFLGNNAAEFIREQQDSDRPFILYVMMFEPHPPYNGPLNDLYNPDDLPVGPNFLEKPADNFSLFSRIRANQYLDGDAEGQQLKSESDWRALRARYYGNVTVMDRGVGKIMRALNETGQADDTMIVFTTDHGDSLGDRGMLGKRAFYDEVARVPLIFHVPWISQEEQRLPGQFGHVDLTPTILDLLGQEPPSYLQGASRAPALRGKTTLEEDDVFMQWHGEPPTISLGNQDVEIMAGVPWRTIVSGERLPGGTVQRWKLSLSPGDQCELFDMTNDPWEQVNLFDDPSHRDRVRLLTGRIRNWQFQTGDTMPLPAV